MPIDLSAGAIELVVDETHGTLLRLAHRRLAIDLIAERELADNFRLLLPLDNWRGHYIHGREQQLREAVRTASGAELVFGPLVSSAGTFDIRFVLTILIEGDDVVFGYRIDNRTSATVEEVVCPLIGGMVNEEERDQWRMHQPNSVGRGVEWDFYREFPGSQLSTYLGPRKPVYFKPYPHDMSMPWADLYHPGRRVGVYFGCHDLDADWSGLFLELSPGVVRGRKGLGWPRRGSLDGRHRLGATLGWARFPFVAPGVRAASPPIVLHFHDGTWYAAAHYYRAWFEQHWPVEPKTSWIARADAWQSNIISYPEDTIVHRFADLPVLAEKAAARGVHLLQVDGWDMGGIDRDYPQYSPDPRLGTPEEFRAALAACSRLGVKVMVFANMTVANIETDWYRRELHAYAVKDPRGFARNTLGWEYHTLLGLSNQVESRMVFMNPSHARWTEIMHEQLSGLLDLGAEGLQIDKVHGFSFLDYHGPEGLSPTRSMPQGVIDSMRGFRDAALARNPGFGFASETHWDRLLPFTDASYSRYFEWDHLPSIGVAFPEFRQSCAVPGHYDTMLVNNSIRFGHVINIEAENLHGTMDEAEPIAGYTAEVLKLRRGLSDVLWDSCLIEAPDLSIEHDGGVLWSVHKSLGSSQRAVVLTHAEETAQSVHFDLSSLDAKSVTCYQPFQAPITLSAVDSLVLPRDRLAVLVAD
jgi:hypothetical protein